MFSQCIYTRATHSTTFRDEALTTQTLYESGNVAFAQSAVEVAAFVHGPDSVATSAHTPSSSSSPTSSSDRPWNVSLNVFGSNERALLNTFEITYSNYITQKRKGERLDEEIRRKVLQKTHELKKLGDSLEIINEQKIDMISVLDTLENESQ